MVRETLWMGIAASDTALASASSVVLFGGFSAAQLALRPFTIVRTRGHPTEVELQLFRG
jgi:hypothetical protein